MYANKEQKMDNFIRMTSFWPKKTDGLKEE